MTARKKPAEGRGSARTNIGAAVNAAVTQERIEQIINEALEAAIGIRAHCPECGAEHRVQIPDFSTIVRTLTALLEQSEGRPELRQPDALQIVIERPARPAA